MIQSYIIFRILRRVFKRSSFFLTLISSLVLSSVIYAVYPMPQEDEAIVLLVLDIKDEAPIIGVIFWSKKAAISEISNVKGRVRIDRFKGQDKIEIQALGYRKKILSYQELTVLDDTLYMEPEIFQLENIVVSATRW